MKTITPIQELISWVEEMENSVLYLTLNDVEKRTLTQFKDKFTSLIEKESKLMHYTRLEGYNVGLEEGLNKCKRIIN